VDRLRVGSVLNCGQWDEHWVGSRFSQTSGKLVPRATLIHGGASPRSTPVMWSETVGLRTRPVSDPKSGLGLGLAGLVLCCDDYGHSSSSSTIFSFSILYLEHHYCGDQQKNSVYLLTGLDWPLCHCAVAQAPPSTNTGAPWPLTGNITGNYQ